MKLSKYVSLNEAIKSPTALRLGIDNNPNKEQLEAMILVATEIFDPVREFAGGPLNVNSFFRSAALNDAIGGSSKTSQHMKGEAVDIDCDQYGVSTNSEIFKFISDNLEFDQLILEYPDEDGKPSWIHVSKTKGTNRNQRLVKLKGKYIPFAEWRVGMV